MEIAFYPRFFIRSLFAHGRSGFFSAGYRLLYPECGRHGMTPWQHYVLEGRRKGFDNGNNPPATVFFREGYELEYPDVKAAGLDPWRHFAEKGCREGRDNGLHPDGKSFFAEGYFLMYPDAAGSGLDPWHHYVLRGRLDGRDNGLHPEEKEFCAEGYLEMYPDAAGSGLDPWYHYVLRGRQEGRDSGHHPDGSVFFPEGYRRNYPCSASEPYGSDPWMNYLKVGKKAGRNNGLCPAGPFFSEGYLESHPGSGVADAWKDYVLNSLKNPHWDAGLYPAGSGMRELLRKRNPSVAVIMPVSGRPEMAMRAVQRVLDQSWGGWHLYIVTNLSDAGTFEYLKSAITDPRINLIRSEGQGASAARNAAISRIRHVDYAAYLDPNDTWSMEYLELMLCRLLETRACCCYCAREMVTKRQDSVAVTERFVYEPFDIRLVHESDCIGLSVLMHRTSVFGDAGVFDTSAGDFSGWDFVQRLAERYSFARLPYVGCRSDFSENETGSSQDPLRLRYFSMVRSMHCADWDFLAAASEKADGSLVSVIVYYGRDDSPVFLRNCLSSLRNARLYGNSRYRTEIILVDDSCSDACHAETAELHKNQLIDRYLVNKDASGFPLGCNRALSLAEGCYAVYLDSQSYVSTGWLDPLISPLKRHKWLKGTSAKALQPDGSVCSAGCLLDPVSGMPYDFLHDLPPDFPQAGRLTLLPCAGSICAAFRTGDAVSARGLSCLYESGLAVSDLCLRLGGSRPCFAFVPSSMAVCPADTSRQASRADDFGVFAESWSGKIKSDDKRHFSERKLGRSAKPGEKIRSLSFNRNSGAVSVSCPDDCHAPLHDFPKLGYGCALKGAEHDLISRIKSLTGLIVIKDPAPASPSYKKYGSIIFSVWPGTQTPAFSDLKIA